MLEYVSANPTGPFHIGHGRWAAMGSALANLLKFYGHEVYQEFYINDAGSQIHWLSDMVKSGVEYIVVCSAGYADSHCHKVLWFIKEKFYFCLFIVFIN